MSSDNPQGPAVPPANPPRLPTSRTRPALPPPRQALPAEITGWLQAWRGGDAASGDRLIAALYGELREMARQRLRGERRQITLQTTALVHETYLRLIGNNRMTFQDRHHFLALSATVMRRVLVDRARERLAGKRGGGAPHVELAEVQAAGLEPGVELLDVDRALDRLAAAFPLQAKVVELRFFGGLEEEEIAGALATSVRTTRRDWAFASAWLARELRPVDARTAEFRAAGDPHSPG